MLRNKEIIYFVLFHYYSTHFFFQLSSENQTTTNQTFFTKFQRSNQKTDNVQLQANYLLKYIFKKF